MDGEAPIDWQTAVKRIDEGEWAGWSSFGAFDPFEHRIGPFYLRQDEDSRPRCAFRAERRHMNGGGFMHGGCLMSFADFALFVIAGPVLDRPAVTATFNAEFAGAVREGELVQATGEVLKAARSLVFVRGLVTADSGVAMSFSGTLKKTGRPPTG